MHQASVGFHCPECVKAHHTTVIRPGQVGALQSMATMVLIGINVAVWVLGQIIWKPTNIIDTSDGAIAKGALLTSGVEVSRSTGQVNHHLIGIANGEWYRIVTAGFLHVSIIHLAVNMWALYVLGRVTEQALGRTRMVLIYMVALVAGSFGALLVSPNQMTLGASGAIFGLMGGLLMVAKSRGVAMKDTGLLGVLGLNLLLTFGLSSYLSVGGHIGGLIGGGLAAFVIIDVPLRVKALRGKATETYAWITAVALIVVLGLGCIALSNRSKSGGLVGVPVAAPARVVPLRPPS